MNRKADVYPPVDPYAEQDISRTRAEMSIEEAFAQKTEMDKLWDVSHPISRAVERLKRAKEHMDEAVEIMKGIKQ